jgi:pilus assembly protein FimV
MAADQEDEDVLGDSMDEESDDNTEDEDLFGEDEEDDESDSEQVVLESDDEHDEDTESETGTKSKWYKSKLVLASASALIVLGITIPLAYFFFFSGGPEQVPEQVARYDIKGSQEVEIQTVNIDVEQQVNIRQSGNITLDGFVILASDASKDMAYITADVSIDYSDQRAYHEIQNNLSFYRGLIYDSINKSLASGKRDEITEADIIWIVETNLKKILPGNYISRVSFKSFKAS